MHQAHLADGAQFGRDAAFDHDGVAGAAYRTLHRNLALNNVDRFVAMLIVPAKRGAIRQGRSDRPEGMRLLDACGYLAGALARHRGISLIGLMPHDDDRFRQCHEYSPVLSYPEGSSALMAWLHYCLRANPQSL